MTSILRQMFLSNEWKRVFAWTVVYGYAYNVIAWPLFQWTAAIGTLVTDRQWAGPPIVPWEQLAAMSATLGIIGGVQIMRDRETNRSQERAEAP